MSRLSTTFSIGVSRLEEAENFYFDILKEGNNILTEEQIIELALRCSSSINIIRATLDHAMMDLAKQSLLFDPTIAQAKRDISFPIKYRTSSFSSWKNHTLGGHNGLKMKDLFGEEVINFLDSLQPYKQLESQIDGRLYFRSAIRDLAALDNHAKHSQPYDIVSFPNAESEQTKLILTHKLPSNVTTTQIEKLTVTRPYFSLRYEQEDALGKSISARYTIRDFHYNILRPLALILEKFENQDFTNTMPSDTVEEREKRIMDATKSMSQALTLMKEYGLLNE